MLYNITKEESLRFAEELDQELPAQFFADAEKIWKSLNEKNDFDMEAGGLDWIKLLHQENKEFLLSAKEKHLEYMFEILDLNDGKVMSYLEELEKSWEMQNAYALEDDEDEENFDADKEAKLQQYYEFVEKRGQKEGKWNFDDKCRWFLELSSLAEEEVNESLTKYVVSLAQKEGKTKTIKGLISHAVSLQKYERTEGKIKNFYNPYALDWIQLCFMNWRCKEKNEEKTREVLTQLYQYVCIATQNLDVNYESFQIHEAFENVLAGDTQIFDTLDWLNEIDGRNNCFGMVLHRDAKLAYELGKQMSFYLSGDGSIDKKASDKIYDLLKEIYEVVNKHYEIHVNEVQAYEGEIKNPQEHILFADSFETINQIEKMEYAEPTEYGRFAFERDYVMFAYDKWLKSKAVEGCDAEGVEEEVFLTEEEAAMLQKRMKECLDGREERAKELYVAYITRSMRRSLMALSMALHMLETLLENESSSIQSDKENAEKLLKDMKALFSNVKASLYNAADAEDVFAYLNWQRDWKDEGDAEDYECLDTPCIEYALRPMKISLGGEANKEKFVKIAKKFDKDSRGLKKEFAALDEELREEYGDYLYSFFVPSVMIMRMLKADKKNLLKMKDDELQFLMVMNQYFNGKVDAGKSFAALLKQYYQHDTTYYTIKDMLEDDADFSNKICGLSQEEAEEAKKKAQEYAEKYFEIIDEKLFVSGEYELTEELKDILENVNESFGDIVEVDTFRAIYCKIMEKILNGGWTIGNTSYKKALVKHMSILTEYLLDTYEWEYNPNLPVSIEELLIFFYSWIYDKQDTKAMIALLKNLYRHILETKNGLKVKYEELHIKEVYEGVLNGEIEFPGEEDGYKPYSFITNAITASAEEGYISKDVAKVYELRDYIAWRTEPVDLTKKEIASLSDDPATLFQEMYALVSELYEDYEAYLTKFREKIQNTREHIVDEDTFAHGYEQYGAVEGYGTLAFQRDYEILRSYRNNEVQDYLSEKEIELVKARIENFLKEREEENEKMYMEFISSNIRRLLYALQMAKEVLDCFLSEELEEVSKGLISNASEKDDLEELCEDMIDLCDDIARKVYVRREEGVKEVMASLTYQRQKDLMQREEEMKDAIVKYRNALQEAWENASLEDLQNMKCENFKQLRNEIPYLTRENLEETVQLYESFLQAKVEKCAAEERLASKEAAASENNTASQDVLVLEDTIVLEKEIKDKCQKIWDEAMKKVAAVYTAEDKEFSPRDMKPFYKPLFTAEYLSKLYVNKNQNDSQDMFDYSSIALEYYTAMEYFLNAVVYVPLKDLYLVGTEIDGYEGYMTDDIHNKLIFSRKYNANCMYGNFGYLFENILSAPALLGFMKELRGTEIAGKGADTNSAFKSNIQTLGKRIATQDDNIAKRRNESAHGGTILPQNKALEARAIVYDSSELDNVQTVHNLKDTFDLILKILDIRIN